MNPDIPQYKDNISQPNTDSEETKQKEQKINPSPKNKAKQAGPKDARFKPIPRKEAKNNVKQVKGDEKKEQSHQPTTDNESTQIQEAKNIKKKEAPQTQKDNVKKQSQKQAAQECEDSISVHEEEPSDPSDHSDIGVSESDEEFDPDVYGNNAAQ